MKVLLVEPNYKNKYPPMGLMKISTYHKMRGDQVRFVKGIDREIDNEVWDRIYITTLFTFHFAIVVDTVLHYKKLVNNVDNIYIGGILATLLPDRLAQATGIKRSRILTGLFTDTSVVGDNTGVNVDELPLDYDILEEISYKYPAGDNYLGYTTRGCPNHCSFCAVPILEPGFRVTNNILNQIREIDKKYGPKRNLLLLDNNVLNTNDLARLVDDLCAAGFARGAKYDDPGAYAIVLMRYRNGDRGEFLNRKMASYLDAFASRIKAASDREAFSRIVEEAKNADDYAAYMLEQAETLAPVIEKYRAKNGTARYLDFNQGVDGRKINDENMAQLSRLAIRPLRIAFDSIRLKDTYAEAVRTAHRHGIKEISNYILFNHKDKPEDLYERLRVNIALNKELGIKIFSFPMKYSPIDRTDRSYVGPHWDKKSLLAISAILQVTKGVVAAGSSFFFKAFGNDIDEYLEILAMPREFIMFRSYFEQSGEAEIWRNLYRRLAREQKERLMKLVSAPPSELKKTAWPNELAEIVPFYLIKYSTRKNKE